MGGAVVEVEAEEGEGDAGGLDGRRGVAEPDDGDGDDEDAFDEGGDRVGDWGDEREEHERDDVLPEVEDAVEDEFERQAAVVQGVVAGC